MAEIEICVNGTNCETALTLILMFILPRDDMQDMFCIISQ